MGFTSKRYKLSLAGEDWDLHLHYDWKIYRFSVRIDEQEVSSCQTSEDAKALMGVKSLSFTHRDKAYRVEFGPISIWRHGLHIYQDGTRVYTFKQRDFVELPRLIKFVANSQRRESEDPSQIPAWLSLLNCGILGGLAGFVAVFFSRWAELNGLFQENWNMSLWITALAVGVITFTSDKVNLFWWYKPKR